MDPVPLIDLRAQFDSLREEIYREIREVIESQSFILGPRVELFENEVAAYLEAGHAVGCASGTDALILSLAAMEIGEGHQVVTSPFSFFATASCAYKVGARPVFADIRPDTFNLDPEKAEGAITPLCRALLPVHLFGQCAEMDALIEIADRRGLWLVEDAAQALGATYDSARRRRTARAGTLGTLGCISFFPTKNLGGFGDGGLVTTRDETIAKKLRALRVHGGLDGYIHEAVGWNSRLDALQAAVLRVKLPHLDDWSRRRAANADRYDLWLSEAGLVASDRVRLPARSPRCRHIFNQYTLRVQDREALRGHLRRSGIGHAVYYPLPLHLQPCFRDLGYGPGDFPCAERAAQEVISLPIHPELRHEQQERVVEAIASFYRSG